MFGSDKQNDQTQTDDQQVDDSIQPDSTGAQDPNVISPSSDPAIGEPTGAPVPDDSASTVDSASGDTSLPPVPDSDVPSTDQAPTGELTDIKQQALQQLTPLVGQLDQTPEEKFRTTMMMIQAADNQSLIKAAYEAAQQIKDEKERAQALLDVINEINYFSQQQKKDS